MFNALRLVHASLSLAMPTMMASPKGEDSPPSHRVTASFDSASTSITTFNSAFCLPQVTTSGAMPLALIAETKHSSTWALEAPPSQYIFPLTPAAKNVRKLLLLQIVIEN